MRWIYTLTAILLFTLLFTFRLNLLTDWEADADVRAKPNRTVSIDVDDDNSKDKVHATHDVKPGAQWL